MSRQLPRLSPEQVRALTLDTTPWLSCEDCFHLMDRYVDGLLGAGPASEPPGLVEHLAGCTACAEEVESLLEVAGDADEAAGRDLEDRA
jgi:anti-sigma factor RsiW